ncbi:D-beta-D-heptose 7-phosphate kinase [Labrenzia sp. THAF82]|uniref:PfkB family carbohydrate kinase n=1 Tax=Labrenzia sp. THAF82 TaxID=2587861 RepID=UPI0012679DCC|nr:PfkB family carbohydrate kinase [Labrenzia sp. THAF82]QFT34372.1 D-beta-D-heptose 7-phosphate kinase [Labrenzia sp. THAF82]
MSSANTGEAGKIREQMPAGGKVVLVSGYFNILHPGHLRLIYYAAEQGDRLVIGLIAKPTDHLSSTLPDNDRKIALQSISCVDDVIVMQHGLEALLNDLKPEVVVMGPEHRGKNPAEENLVESYGGHVVYSSGASVPLAPNGEVSTENAAYRSSILKPVGYLDRHQVTLEQLRRYVVGFQDLNLWVIGDTIIDEYAFCDAVGMSREDPTIVVRPLKSNLFLGGAGIVAGHARNLGAKVTFATVTGDDEPADFAEAEFAKHNINGIVIRDAYRKTTHKKRYRAEDKTMLRVNNFTEQAIDEEAQEEIVAAFETEAATIDAIIFSDFNYGILPQSLVKKITDVAQRNNVLVAADSQTSSQIGDISRYKNAKLLTPTEREVRVALQNSEDGIVILAEQLCSRTNAGHVYITLGSDGLLIHSSDPTGGSHHDLKVDRLPAMNQSPKDPAGAGDAMLVMSTLVLASGGTIWEAAYLGSIASACQVGRVGNIPLKPEEIIRELMHEEHV